MHSPVFTVTYERHGKEKGYYSKEDYTANYFTRFMTMVPFSAAGRRRWWAMGAMSLEIEPVIMLSEESVAMGVSVPLVIVTVELSIVPIVMMLPIPSFHWMVPIAPSLSV